MNLKFVAILLSTKVTIWCIKVFFLKFDCDHLLGWRDCHVTSLLWKIELKWQSSHLTCDKTVLSAWHMVAALIMKYVIYLCLFIHGYSFEIKFVLIHETGQPAVLRVKYFKHEYLRSRAYICLSLSSPSSSCDISSN